jgi:hypothetical protein
MERMRLALVGIVEQEKHDRHNAQYNGESGDYVSGDQGSIA